MDYIKEAESGRKWQRSFNDLKWWVLGINTSAGAESVLKSVEQLQQALNAGRFMP